MAENEATEQRKPQGKSMYRYIAEAWADAEHTYVKALNYERRIRWRKEENFVRIDKPTRLDRARAVGYKAKQGYILVRGRVRRGALRKRTINAGRRAKRKVEQQQIVGKSLQRIAEERAQKRFQNLEVLNSYWVGADGQHEWYEIILVDPGCPVIQRDRKIGWVADNKNKNRVYRGLTAAGHKGRGLLNKGHGGEKVRPSAGAKGNRSK